MKVNVLPFHAMYDINDNMYENVIIISKKSKEIISKTPLIKQDRGGFDSTDEIVEQELDFDPNQEKAIVSTTQDF